MIATGKTQKNIEDIYPLSQNQSSFLFGHIRAQTNDPGKVQVRCRLEGKMDKALFEASWRWTVARHPVLRSSIHWNNLAQPVQVVHQHVDIQIDFGEYLEVDAEQRQSRIEDYVDAERGAWLALDKPPLFRLGVLSFTDNTHLLCWTCHHILIDGWSVGIVLGDVIKHYQSSLEHVAYDPPQPRKYHDYVSWLAEQDYAEARKLWRAWFSVKPLLRTAGRGQRIAGDTDTEASRSVSMRLDPQTYGNLKRMVSEQRSTMGLVVQALWAALLHLLSRNEQVEFSIAVSGRAVDLPGVDTMIGQFASTLPVVLSVNPRQTFSELLGQMSTCAGQLRRFEHVTPTKIQEWGLTPMGTKVLAGAGGRYVDSVVVIENFPWRATDHVEHESSLRLLSLDGDLASHFDLTLAVIEDSDLTLRLDSRGLIDVALARSLLNGVSGLVDCFAASPNRSIEVSLDEIARCRTLLSEATMPAAGAAAVKPADNLAYAPPRDNLEWELVTLWEMTLNTSPIGVNDDFFDLGGDSILAVAMYADIEKVFGCYLPLSTIIQHRTVAQLAELIRRPEQHEFRSLVPIQPHGSQRPVFGVHAEGDVVFYKDLAQSLGEDQPFFGLQALHLDGASDPLHSIEAMASHYVSEIRQAQPAGPYALVGMCFGGLIAFEMAYQLASRGESVDTLVVIDALSPGVSLPRKIVTHLRDGRLVEVARKYVRTMVKPAWSVKKKKAHGPGAREIGRRMRADAQHQAELIKRYRPNLYPGSLVSVRNESVAEVEMTRWRKFADKGVEFHVVPGGHSQIMRAPYVENVSGIIRSLLQAGRTASTISTDAAPADGADV